jgi:hypothetical protein
MCPALPLLLSSCAAVASNSGQDLAEFRAQFDKADLNNDGFIEPAEFDSKLATAPVPVPAPAAPAPAPKSAATTSSSLLAAAAAAAALAALLLLPLA